MSFNFVTIWKLCPVQFICYILCSAYFRACNTMSVCGWGTFIVTTLISNHNLLIIKILAGLLCRPNGNNMKTDRKVSCQIYNIYCLNERKNVRPTGDSNPRPSDIWSLISLKVWCSTDWASRALILIQMQYCIYFYVYKSFKNLYISV